MTPGKKKWPLHSVRLWHMFSGHNDQPRGRQERLRWQPRVTAQPRKPLRSLITHTEVPSAAVLSTRVPEPPRQARLLDPDSKQVSDSNVEFYF